jgi:TolA-binding protein
MRHLGLLFALVSLGASPAMAAPAKKTAAKVPAKTQPTTARKAEAPVATGSPARQQLARALDMAKRGEYQNAANQLFALSKKPELQGDRAQIKYILGIMLMELKMNQVAAFQFVDVIRLDNPKYKKQAIDKLSVVADMLGDDTLLEYAISRVDVADIPANNRDMIYFRLGEVKQKARDFEKAADYFGKVQLGSSYYNQALYNKGLAQAEQNKTTQALDTFRTLLSLRSRAGVTDTNKVAAQLAIARTLYQAQKWDESIEAYAQVPRDHYLWHSALFEQSWAMLRGARFRSVLSNFQSQHSSYYEDYYIPESLLLRAIVYLYICKYDEMEKVLTLFEKTYGPVRTQVNSFIGSNRTAYDYYSELEKAQEIKRGRQASAGLRLPYNALRYVLDQGDVRRAFIYLKALNDERARIENNPSLKNSSLGAYAMKIIANRNKNKKIAIGEMAKADLLNIQSELSDLYEQAGFIRYEMISGKKENLKKKIAGTDLAEAQIDDNIDREFYIENGYQYYPFSGEYWLDEIGNYHYLGKQSCE